MNARACFLALAAVQCTTGLATIHYRTFPELVQDSPVIVQGMVSMESGATTLAVERVLKGSAGGQLNIGFHHEYDVPDPRFQNGEAVILFLDNPDANGVSYLFGLSDQAKWPRRYPEKPNPHIYYRHYPHLQDNASLSAIRDLVEKLLKMDSLPEAESEGLCADYVRSPNRLLQFTAMEYVTRGNLWFAATTPLSSFSPERRKTWGRFGELALSLSLPDSNEPTIRGLALELLNCVSTDRAMPHFIKNITHADRYVRSVASAGLRERDRQIKMVGERLGSWPNPDDPSERLREVQREWTDWWDRNKDRVIASEKTGTMPSD